jgi:hypothetical protein
MNKKDGFPRRAGMRSLRRAALLLVITGAASGWVHAQPQQAPDLPAASTSSVPAATGLGNLGSRQGAAGQSTDMLKLAPQGDSERSFVFRPGVPDMDYQTAPVGGVAPLGGGVKLKAAVGASSAGGVVGVGLSVPW